MDISYIGIVWFPQPHIFRSFSSRVNISANRTYFTIMGLWWLLACHLSGCGLASEVTGWILSKIFSCEKSITAEGRGFLSGIYPGVSYREVIYGAQ